MIIIQYLQDNDINSNNELIDKLFLETNKEKHELLLKKYKIQIILIIEKKEIVVYYVKKHMKKQYHHILSFFIVNEDNIKEKTLLTIFILKTKEYYTTEYICKKEKDEYLTTITSFPDYFFVLIDMDYNTLVRFKNDINNLSEKELLLGFNIYYKLIGLILVPYENHTIYFNLSKSIK